MLTVRPDFYDRFTCLASRCRHSCCIGWEIDIDEDSQALYAALPGEIGDKLRANCRDGHFVLTAGEHCPLLRRDGLCELILAHGEEALCDICYEHPRFYNELSDRTEEGLGLCCEAVTALLLESGGPLALLTEEDDEPAEPDGAELALLSARDACFSLLERSGTLLNGMERAAALHGLSLPRGSVGDWAEELLSLEQMDGAWTALLRACLSRRDDPFSTLPEGDGPFLRMAEYFLYRHYVPAGERAGEMLCLCFLLTALAAAFSGQTGDLGDTLRLLSAELEYSDENMDILLNKIRERIEQ